MAKEQASHVMNKNVDHNGKHYSKGEGINEGSDGFAEMVKLGHADKIDMKVPEVKKDEKHHKGEK